MKLPLFSPIPGCWCSPGHQQEIRKWWDIHWKRWKGTKTCVWHGISLRRCFFFILYRPLELAVAEIVDYKSDYVLKWSEVFKSLFFLWLNTVLTWEYSWYQSLEAPSSLLTVPPSLLEACVRVVAIWRLTRYFNYPI